MTIRENILEVLSEAGSAMQTAALLAAVGGSDTAVRNELTRLVEAGLVVRPRHGHYRLPRALDGVVEGSREILRGFREGRSELVNIPLADVSVSAGPGTDTWSEQAESFVSMSWAYVRRLTGADPQRLVMIVATGDSMLPTIQPGDRLLVCKHDGSTIVDGGIYIWRTRWADVAVKRARLSGSRVVVQGDNDREPAASIARGDNSPDWEPIARVLRVEKPL